MSDSPAAADGVGAWRWNAHRDFVLTCVSRFAVTVGTQMQTVAIGWFVYDVTG